MTQQRAAEGKERHTGDRREELQTLVRLTGLSALFLQNQELRSPTLSSFHLLPGIVTSRPTWVGSDSESFIYTLIAPRGQGDQENQWEGPEKKKNPQKTRQTEK